MFILLNLFKTGSCSRFGGAVVSEWLRLVKPPCALFLPLVADAGVWLIRRAFWIFLSWVCSIYPEARRR